MMADGPDSRSGLAGFYAFTSQTQAAKTKEQPPKARYIDVSIIYVRLFVTTSFRPVCHAAAGLFRRSRCKTGLVNDPPLTPFPANIQGEGRLARKAGGAHPKARRLLECPA